MAETLKKTGPATFTLTYGSTMPFTMLVYDFTIDPVADLFDATAGANGRAYGTTGLATGTCTCTGYMTVASAIALLSNLFQQTTMDFTDGTSKDLKKISILGTTGTGANSGYTANPIVLYGLIERAPIKVSKTAGYVGCMIVFRLCHEPV